MSRVHPARSVRLARLILKMKNARNALLLLTLLIPFSVYAQRDPPVDQFEFKSSLLGKTINYRILYPVEYQYAHKREKRFPVLYVLHGVTGHNSDWLEKTRVALYATHYDL